MTKRWSTTLLVLAVLASLPAMALAPPPAPPSPPAPGLAAPGPAPAAAAAASSASTGAAPGSGFCGEGEGEGEGGSRRHRPGGPRLGVQDPAARRGQAEPHGGQARGAARAAAGHLHVEPLHRLQLPGPRGVL